MIRRDWILWAIYLGLLAVLFPHTSWVFQQFEPEGWSQAIGWVAAFVFECGIAAITWRLKRRIESTPNYRTGNVSLRRFHYRYVNWFGAGLLVLLTVSLLANWAHAVEFGKTFKVFDDYSIPPALFPLAFGAILPVTSLLFIGVLAEVQETEQEENEELMEANRTIRELRKRVKGAEEARTLAEQRFGAIGDLVARLFSEVKRERILAVRQTWPELPPKYIAMITEASPSHVSGVLKEIELEGERHEAESA